MATKWGCLGPGKIAEDFFKAIKYNLPSNEHEFVAVASRDLNRAQVFADKLQFRKVYDSYEELSQDGDVDIVYVATIHTTHVELCTLLLNAGKKILCEKPMAMNSVQAKVVLDLAKEKRLFFAEGFWSRHFPLYHHLREELVAGSIGDVRLIQASICIPIGQVDRIWDIKLGGGGCLDIGIYAVQFACFVFQEMPVSITAVGNLFSSGADENACIILKYSNGAMANLTYHVSILGENSARIIGTKGIIEIKDPFWCPSVMTTPLGPLNFPLKDEGGVQYNFHNSSGMQYQAEAIRNCLLKNEVEHEFVTHKDSELVHKIMDEIRKQIGMIYPDFD